MEKQTAHGIEQLAVSFALAVIVRIAKRVPEDSDARLVLAHATRPLRDALATS